MRGKRNSKLYRTHSRLVFVESHAEAAINYAYRTLFLPSGQDKIRALFSQIDLRGLFRCAVWGLP